MEIRPGIEVDEEQLRHFCERHAVQRLAVFGSALREDFREDSDIDVLAEFSPGRVPGLLRIAQMEVELGALLSGREVEIRTYEDLSRHFRDDVLEQAASLYVAA